MSEPAGRLPDLETRQAAASRYAEAIDSRALERDLRGAVAGDVLFDSGSRAMYAVDASNYRQVPIGVVRPMSTEDVIEAVRVARRYGAPILSRGGGTSLAGQCCNVAVVLDFSRYLDKVLEIDPETRTARVQPGCILDTLRDAAKRHGLTFGPDPATHNRNTLGGMLGNNSCGIHSVMSGRTADNTEELDVLLYDGTRLTVGSATPAERRSIIEAGGRRAAIYDALEKLRERYGDRIRARYPDIPRRVSGYNLDELLEERGFHVARSLVGSESTCVVILEAKLRLVPHPRCRTLVILGYPDVGMAGDQVIEVMEQGPIGLEGMDEHLVEDMRRTGTHTDSLRYLPEGKGWLFAEFGADTQEEANRKARHAAEAIRRIDPDHPNIEIYEDAETQARVWAAREAGLGATAWVPGTGGAWPGWEDAAVPPQNLGTYLREFRELMKRYGYHAALYGHFGQGCVHCRINFDLRTAEGISTYRAFIEEAADMVVRFGGSLSGEHGDGQSRGFLLPRMFGQDLVEAFREFKRIWDPDWKMNPGKVIDPFDPTENLRLGTDYNPWEPKTEFRYPDDRNAFSRAALRCVGVGKCRRLDGGTMCPSYMVTREEKHSTRGRAHLLFEMLRGEIIRDGWKSKEVKESLDLCLACKGCKGDCPVDVDMATYKAEFLSHYYESHLRPRSAWAFGLIMWWARIASKVPWLVNFMTHAPVLSFVAKALANIPARRSIPRFANRTFRDWYDRRDLHNIGSKKVVLWADTFNNYFHPPIARAATEVLESAGYHVIVPRKGLCCGRPLYDYGMLGLARTFLSQILDSLRPEIRDGVPVVGLEPSCVSVFRDELHEMFPHDEDAKRLREQTYLFSEFLMEHESEFELSRLNRKAVLHGHCHHKAVLDFESEKNLLERLGLEIEVPDSGCCGMAGAFGFEKEHYEVSIACGERVLLPAVREAADEALIITDGFSCHEQIVQTTERRPLHVAEVVRMALEGSD